MDDEQSRWLADRYELQDELGRGGAGRVHRAHDHRLDRPVAVKLLTDLGATARQRFRREAATAARVAHRNVVALVDAGVDHETPFLVMRLVEGPSLADRVTRQGPLDGEQARRLAADLLAGLDATHRAGVLHRDLTPRNVLFDPDGTAMLADFGIARGADDTTLTAAHTVVGTRPYLAPERLRGHAATPATDLFSAGVTLQHAITGRHDVPVPRDHPLAPLVTACTAPSPEARPADARAAMDRLHALGRPDDELPETTALPTEVVAPQQTEDHAAGTQPVPSVDPATAEHDRARRRTVVLGTVAAVALVGALGAYGLSRDTPSAGPDTTESTEQSGTAGGAPTYDADDPAGSARDLADWLRQHG